jgi:hypothetical protein
MRFRIRILFDADPDLGYKNDADPCRSGSTRLATVYKKIYVVQQILKGAKRWNSRLIAVKIGLYLYCAPRFRSSYGSFMDFCGINVSTRIFSPRALSVLNTHDCYLCSFKMSYLNISDPFHD